MCVFKDSLSINSLKIVLIIIIHLLLKLIETTFLTIGNSFLVPFYKDMEMMIPVSGGQTNS